MAQFFAYVQHADGVIEDTAGELVAAAKAMGADSVTAIVTGSGIDAAASAAGEFFNEVYKVDNDALAYPNAEVVRKAVAAIVPADAVILMSHTTFAMDLAPGLSIVTDSAFLADVTGIDGVDGSTLKVVRTELGGSISAHVNADIANGAVITLRPGSVEAAAGGVGGAVVDKSADAGDLSAKRKFLEVVALEAGEVDITTAEVLVSVGRGIEDEDNIELAMELKEAIGSKAEVACSRPIVDAKWLEHSRQVGTSGLSVKPNVYLALGISGSFQHLGGIKGGVLIAVNKNPNAPIFQVADYGIEADILDFIPALTEKIKDL
ncbi:MAG: electron transfer flavoprotein subunit alpha/FixB family protein [Desulforegulaceae bacterium]|nr:electron transfer flavoprotein subunit alpha/FixB family protein [Desulforegulaceae bacterium]